MKKVCILSLLLGLAASSNLIALPSVNSTDPDVNALVQLAHSEVQKNIRKDGSFCAGANWPTAWTRDMSYAIDLSLSFLFPKATEKSLESRVENDIILQDTGSGGSWPVSTDRITWITAAYDYALIKQSPEYFEWVFQVGEKTLNQDFNVNFDSERGIFRGESSFLDWREQTYPRWATSEYIAESYALGTNMMYYSALDKMASLARITGKKQEILELWVKRAASLKKAILKNFWLEEKGYFASLLLKDIYTYTYPGYETLGESLGIILGLAPEQNYKKITGAVKPQEYGLSVVSPQLSTIPSYHNDAVWPFVQGYRVLACKKAGDFYNAQNEFTAMVTAAKKFGTFKENYIASVFSPETQTNSDRQLWSDAGFLACIYRIFLGINFTEKGITFSPLLFESMKNGISMENLQIGKTSLSVEVNGSGDTVDSFLLNGVKMSENYILPYAMLFQEKANPVKIKIALKKSEKFENFLKKTQQNDKNGQTDSASLNSADSVDTKAIFDAATVTPQIPNAIFDSDGKKTEISFKPKNKGGWKIVKDNKSQITDKNEMTVKAADTVQLIQAFALPAENSITKTSGDVQNDSLSQENEFLLEDIPLFPSKTVRAENYKNTSLIEAEKSTVKGGSISEENQMETLKARISSELSKTDANFANYVKDFGKEEGEYIEFTFSAKKDGDYAVDFRFKNGHGPVNTGEKCALLALSADGNLVRRLAFPQQGSWTSWSFTAPTVLHLEKGSHKIRLYTDQWCHTQHSALNPIHLDLMRVARVK